VPVAIAHKYGKFDLTTVWRLRGLLNRITPDLVHAYLPAASFLTPMTRWLGVTAPVLQSERGVNDWRSPFRLRCDNFVRRSAVHITCNADAIKRHLVDVEGVPAEKVSVIYNGLHAARRTPPDAGAIADATAQIGAPEGAIVVASVANFSPIKRHDVLIRAFAQARGRVDRLFLLLVGQGPLEASIRLQVEHLGLGGACRIITDCPNPRALLWTSHIAVLTSALEGCSNALLEAMAMGLPAVASDTGGNGELIVHERGGLLCPVGNVASFADALARLALDRSAAERMGQHNMQRIRERFTDDTLVAQSLELYRRILDCHWSTRAGRPSGDPRANAAAPLRRRDSHASVRHTR